MDPIRDDSLDARERSRRVLQIARAAMDTEPTEWAELVSQRCGDDLALKQQVEALLDRVARLQDESLDVEAASTAPYARLGAFRLVEVLGRGGMGEVWRGERADGAFRQQVAIKLVQQAGPFGLVERFQRERDILARLNHGNIAHLIDGGVAADGRPWLALEYVQGERVTRWADRQRLPVDARVRLLLPVCEAVQFAHQNLVIHRDIKPGNLLVNDDGVPKLLDFGIAKLLDGQDDPGQTRTLVMTPAYAAPEQRRGEAITTATDVYQLGLMLFELVAGLAPNHPCARFGDADAADTKPTPAQMLQAFARGDPEAASALAEARRTSVKALVATLRGDLGQIIEKATASRAADRYGSARELADDLGNWLRRRPVRARRASGLYRTWKFVVRNRVATALGVSTVAALAVGMAGMRWQADRALQEAERANAVQDYLVDIFSASVPGAPTDRLPGTRELLERGRDGVLLGFDDRPETRAELLTVLARIHSQLGLYEEARQMAAEAVQLRRSLYGERHIDHLASLFELGEALRLDGTFTEAGPLFVEALRLAQAIPADALTQARVRQSLGIVQSLTGDHADAERNLRLALTEFEQMGEPQRDSVIDVLHSLALALDRSEQFDGAESAYRHALALARPHFGEIHAKVANLLGDYAALIRPLGRFAEAEALLQEAVAIDRQVHQAPHPVAALHLRNLAGAQTVLGKIEEAEQSMRAAMALTEAIHGADSLDIAKARINFSALLLDSGRAEDAIGELEQSLAFFEASSEDHRLERGFILVNLGRAHRALADWMRARDYLERAIALRTDLHGPDHPQTAQAIGHLARLELLMGDAEAAEQQFRRALVIAQGRLDDKHPQLADRHLNLGEALQALGRHDEAIVHFRRSLRICGEAGLADDHGQVADSHLLLADSLLAIGKLPEALDHLRAIWPHADKTFPDGSRLRERWNRLSAHLG